MTWNAPQTWVTGQIVTAADLNGDLRDNMLHLGGMKRNGTAFQSLAGSSEILGNWGCRAYNTSNITASNTTWTNLTFNTESWDSGTIHSTSTNTQNFTVPVAGKYIARSSVYWAANATGLRQTRVTKNGTQWGEIGETVGSSAAFSQQYIDVVECAAGDVLVFQVWQNTGGNLDVQQVTTYGISACVQWIGAT